MLPHMDATELGIQLFFLILLPGFTSGAGFRFTSRSKGNRGDFASICYASLWGLALFFVWQSSLGNDSGEIAKYVQSPLTTGFMLATVGFFLGLLMGLPIGWVRSKIR